MRNTNKRISRSNKRNRAGLFSPHLSSSPNILLSSWIVKVLVTQSCPTLCDSMDCSSPGSSVHGILQARALEWVAFPFSRGSSRPRIEPRSPPVQMEEPSEPPHRSVCWITLQLFYADKEQNKVRRVDLQLKA